MPKTRTVHAQSGNMQKILTILHDDYDDAHCALKHNSPLQLLAATILSAQCTDERVNLVTKKLFRKFKKAEDYANSPPGEIEEIIRSTGFFNNKAKSLRGMGRVLVDEFSGRVPKTMEELLSIPGVARKTANVVLGTWYGTPEGVVVDTHVKRITGRLGLTREKSPEKIERDLMKILPQDEWTFFSHAIIWHGRKVCKARTPDCDSCHIQHLCPEARLIPLEAKKTDRRGGRRKKIRRTGK